MLKIIDSSNFGILPTNKVEVERITEKHIDNIIYSIRVRNISKKNIKINSFVVSEFLIPQSFEVDSVLENNWLQCSEIKYKKVNESTVENREFLQRDQNPLSYKKEYGYVQNSIISEWFTSINFKDDKNLFLGAVTTKDQFSQIYIKSEDVGVFVRVTCQFDGLILKPGQVVKSEKIFVGYGEEVKNKDKFAKALAHYMKVKSIKKPIKAMCCSYYWNANKITEEVINTEIDAIENLPDKLDLDYIQLDAGYTPYFGDWLSYKERFPNGFKNIIERIKNLGYEAGIWISPFSINPGTKLHDHHKSWLIKDGYKKHFEGRWTSPFDNVSNITDLEVLDPTKLEVKEYLRKVLTHFKDLGFKLFKIDFMYPVCLTNNYSKPVTRAQALRQGVEYIREVLGDDCVILSGITQLSSVVGIADFVRTGIDTLNPFVSGIPIVNTMVNEYMFESNLSESSQRSFLNGIVWRADPDVLIFSENLGISKDLIRKQHKFVKENQMSMWIGESISKMDNKQKSYLQSFF